jgi:hypothetical protein
MMVVCIRKYDDDYITNCNAMKEMKMEEYESTVTFQLESEWEIVLEILVVEIVLLHGNKDTTQRLSRL